MEFSNPTKYSGVNTRWLAKHQKDKEMSKMFLGGEKGQRDHELRSKTPEELRTMVYRLEKKLINVIFYAKHREDCKIKSNATISMPYGRCTCGYDLVKQLPIS